MITMTENSFNAIFATNLRKYLSYYDMTQVDLSKRLGVGTTSVYNWCNGVKTPRMDKVDAMCRIFNCKRSDLISEHTNDSLETDPAPVALREDEKQLLSMYNLLDAEDKAEVRGYTRGLMRSEKYTEDSVEDVG